MTKHQTPKFSGLEQWANSWSFYQKIDKKTILDLFKEANVSKRYAILWHDVISFKGFGKILIFYEFFSSKRFLSSNGRENQMDEEYCKRLFSSVRERSVFMEDSLSDSSDQREIFEEVPIYNGRGKLVGFRRISDSSTIEGEVDDLILVSND